MLGVITVAIVTAIFLISELPRDRPESIPATPPSQATAKRTKRSETGKSDECFDYYDSIELDNVKGSTASYTFDLCAVIKCKGLNSSWRDMMYAVEGLAEQLGPTSLMAVQNRMALDMLLGEKGGVCAMFGDMYCTFILNNTAPDSSVTRTLEGLKTLSTTMYEHSGVDNLLEGWMTSVFGQWKGFIMSIMVSLSVFTAILVTCGCCCVPCIQCWEGYF